MSVITRLKVKFFPNTEFHFKGYTYAGQGTKLREKILNLDYLLKFFGEGHNLDSLEALYKSPMFLPINKCDKWCLEHDLFYEVSEQYDDKERKRKEQTADELLIYRLEELIVTLAPYSEERLDCLFIIGIIKLKQIADKEKSCCCLLS